ncbi:sensor histidine kinase [Denitromonas halophila]|uniref:histidine kinase n=1 Tax=Denitromonas halophila TaxID=1629404 RepID=A0A557R0Y4_9RHOO|nr:sensor histidine kinase [Denitromonas halophila]TVO58794.1 sensor histidine kinase [Denitromonas halophila]
MKHSVSLRRRVAIWLLPSLLLLLLINAALSYLGALDAVNRAYDRSLTASIKSIAERVHSLEGNIAVDVPYSAFDAFEGGVQERIFYAVIGPDGALITGYEALTPPGGLIPDGPPRIIDGQFQNEDVRIGAMKKRLYDPALTGGDAATIIFAETTESRLALARVLFADSLQRQVLLVIFGTVILAFALTTAFKPLLKLRDAIRERDEADLTPIAHTDVPSEVRPLIDAINHHTDRLSTMMAARRRLLADAAHQIRTPLAVLSTQIEYGQRQSEPAEIQHTFKSLLGTIHSTRRMADQLLALSHAESLEQSPRDRTAVDMHQLAKEVCLEQAPLALQKRIELAFEGDGEAPVRGNAQMLRELISNLLDNAIRYSPPETQVVVATGCLNGVVALSVGDEGPGIPPAERDKVFQRFYRILGQGTAPGSGLGLAIVQEIVSSHGGQITLDQTSAAGGLTILVEFAQHRPGAPR